MTHRRTLILLKHSKPGLTPSGTPVYPVPRRSEPFTLPPHPMPEPLHTHIFEGHRRRLRLLGYHHHSGGRIDLLSRTTPDYHQVYEARLEHVLPDGRTAAKVNSSFFPDQWSRQEVAHAVRCAFQNRTPVVRDDGRPTLSPTLTELVEARISEVPMPVRDVLDALAVAEPLDTDLLAAVTDADALADAEMLGLVSVDATVRPASVRLAHPLFGEIQNTSSLRLRRLRGRIATELAGKNSTDPRDLIRRAVLTVESDLPPEPELLLAASAAAMSLLDHRLAETLAERAVATGGGPWANIARAMAITWQERGVEAETVLAEQAEQASGLERTQIAILRAMNFTLIQGTPDRIAAIIAL